jgi:hypothetical protein
MRPLLCTPRCHLGEMLPICKSLSERVRRPAIRVATRLG